MGTPNQARAIETAAARLRSYGLDVHTQSYDVWLSRPNSIQVSMTKPYLRSATVKEKPMPWSEDYDNVVVGYNAYSPPGDVSGQVVYANYGLPEDYAELDGWASPSRARSCSCATGAASAASRCTSPSSTAPRA